MLIEIPSFNGMAPKVEARDLPLGYAQNADNADLDQRFLKPFYDVGDVKTLDNTDWRSIFPIESGGVTFWLCTTNESHFVNAPVYSSGGRVYWTDGVRGKETNYTLASNAGALTYGSPNSSYYLGMPKPSEALTATVRGTGDGTVSDSVVYIYTYVSSLGYEGEPSDPTSLVNVEGGQYIELGNFKTSVPANYNIVGIRIYRTSTGIAETDFQLVTEILTGASSDYITPAEIISNSDIWDDKDTGDNELTDADDLGEVITCVNYIEPPSALTGLLALPNGVVAAFRVREVYLSEPYVHYGFPDDYVLTTHFDIKAIGHYGTTIIVGTKGNPYKINGYDPQAVSQELLPDQQSCLFTRAMVSGETFVLYPSPDGLYKIGDDFKGNVTAAMFTKEQWRALLTTSTSYDKTIIAFLYDDKYYAFFEGTNEGFIIDFASKTQAYATFTLDSTYSVYGGYMDLEDDTLYLLIKIGTTYYIREWEGSSSFMHCTWKSKINVTPYTFFSCMKVNGDFSDDSSGTGTISTSGTAVTGVGTSFDTQLKAGYVIYDSSSKTYREIASVTDATHCVLVTAFTSNLTATAFKYNSSMVNLYLDDSLFFTRALNQTSPFRIPSGRGREWEIELKTEGKIYPPVKLAQAMDELL